GTSACIGKHRLVAFCCEQLFRSIALDGRLCRVLPQTWLGEVDYARSRRGRTNARSVGRCRTHRTTRARDAGRRTRAMRAEVCAFLTPLSRRLCVVARRCEERRATLRREFACRA